MLFTGREVLIGKNCTPGLEYGMLLNWGMGNGEWGMGNGEWGMGNGEWGMGNEK